jgi:hypothetical protein
LSNRSQPQRPRVFVRDAAKSHQSTRRALDNSLFESLSSTPHIVLVGKKESSLKVGTILIFRTEQVVPNIITK